MRGTNAKELRRQLHEVLAVTGLESIILAPREYTAQTTTKLVERLNEQGVPVLVEIQKETLVNKALSYRRMYLDLKKRVKLQPH